MRKKHRGLRLVRQATFVPKGFEVLFLDYFHISSVLDELITSPVPSQCQTQRPLFHQHIEGVLFLRHRF